MVFAIAQVHQSQQSLNLLAVLVHALPVNEQWQAHVLLGGEGGEQIVELKDEADFAAAHDCDFVVTQFRQRLAGQGDLAVARVVEAAEQMEQGGLARTGRPHDGDELAFVDDETHAA